MKQPTLQRIALAVLALLLIILIWVDHTPLTKALGLIDSVLILAVVAWVFASEAKRQSLPR